MLLKLSFCLNLNGFVIHLAVYLSYHTKYLVIVTECYTKGTWLHHKTLNYSILNILLIHIV